MHVRFLDRYIFTPDEDRRTCVVYRAGWSGPVRRICADKAIAEGKAMKVPTPVKKVAD